MNVNKLCLSLTHLHIHTFDLEICVIALLSSLGKVFENVLKYFLITFIKVTNATFSYLLRLDHFSLTLWIWKELSRTYFRLKNNPYIEVLD